MCIQKTSIQTGWHEFPIASPTQHIARPVVAKYKRRQLSVCLTPRPECGAGGVGGLGAGPRDAPAMLQLPYP
jgi:hypothetical protein